MATYKEKAELLTTCFGMYGHGNFNLTISEIADILSLIDNYDQEGIKKLYDELEQTRMG